MARPPKRKAAENRPLAESDTDDDCDSESQSDQESELPELKSEDCETSEDEGMYADNTNYHDDACDVE